MENPFKIDDLGVPLYLETPTCSDHPKPPGSPCPRCPGHTALPQWQMHPVPPPPRLNYMQNSPRCVVPKKVKQNLGSKQLSPLGPIDEALWIFYEFLGYGGKSDLFWISSFFIIHRLKKKNGAQNPIFAGKSKTRQKIHPKIKPSSVHRRTGEIHQIRDPRGDVILTDQSFNRCELCVCVCLCWYKKTSQQNSIS